MLVTQPDTSNQPLGLQRFLQTSSWGTCGRSCLRVVPKNRNTLGLDDLEDAPLRTQNDNASASGSFVDVQPEKLAENSVLWLKKFLSKKNITDAVICAENNIQFFFF